MTSDAIGVKRSGGGDRSVFEAALLGRIGSLERIVASMHEQLDELLAADPSAKKTTTSRKDHSDMTMQAGSSPSASASAAALVSKHPVPDEHKASPIEHPRESSPPKPTSLAPVGLSSPSFQASAFNNSHVDKRNVLPPQAEPSNSAAAVWDFSDHIEEVSLPRQRVAAAADKHHGSPWLFDASPIVRIDHKKGSSLNLSRPPPPLVAPQPLLVQQASLDSSQVLSSTGTAGSSRRSIHVTLSSIDATEDAAWRQHETTRLARDQRGGEGKGSVVQKGGVAGEAEDEDDASFFTKFRRPTALPGTQPVSLAHDKQLPRRPLVDDSDAAAESSKTSRQRQTKEARLSHSPRRHGDPAALPHQHDRGGTSSDMSSPKRGQQGKVPIVFAQTNGAAQLSKSPPASIQIPPRSLSSGQGKGHQGASNKSGSSNSRADNSQSEQLLPGGTSPPALCVSTSSQTLQTSPVKKWPGLLPQKVKQALQPGSTSKKQKRADLIMTTTVVPTVLTKSLQEVIRRPDMSAEGPSTPRRFLIPPATLANAVIRPVDSDMLREVPTEIFPSANSGQPPDSSAVTTGERDVSPATTIEFEVEHDGRPSQEIYLPGGDLVTADDHDEVLSNISNVSLDLRDDDDEEAEEE